MLPVVTNSNQFFSGCPISYKEVNKQPSLVLWLGCHAGGGNIVGGSTLRLPELEQNGLSDPSALYKLLYEGKGRMPGFGAECAPKGQCTFGPRLTDDELSAMAQYVLQQAQKGW